MANTIRILVATDNHVGYNERDAVRADDSWKTFDEIMVLAKDKDVDMVLLAGDLFHDNVPSRSAMYHVMRSLRKNCYGDKPCELQILSDASQHFDNTIGHANYQDPDINVAIPVFSIHGNHDDPSGNGHYAALDILEMAGLLNYFGRMPESDNIHVRPVLLQKGNTKLALYGISNGREERMHRSFRDHRVKFYTPTTQPEDWYNIACVHQNHFAHTPTSYLPENFLPTELDLVIWGHEHECDIEPRVNPEMGFRVMQPGSSVATSLNPGEAVPKQVALLSITGRDIKCEPIRLKTVRPFVYKEIVLSQEKEAVKIAHKDNHRHKLTEWLQRIVDGLIQQAREQWEEAQAEDADSDTEEPNEFPLPLIRLRVETSPYDMNTKFEIENPQRFSNRFTGKVANNHDVIQFHMRKRTTGGSRKATIEELKQSLPDSADFSTLKVSELVQDFLAAQSLTILPQNHFGDAVNQYIDKDDKHAMDMFVNESLAKQVGHLVSMHEADEDEGNEDEIDLATRIDIFRSELEEMFRRGSLKSRIRGKARFKPRPDGWDSDLDGDWEDQPGALLRPDEDGGEDEDMLLNDEEEESSNRKVLSTRGARGRGRGNKSSTTTARGGRGAAKTRATAAASSSTSTRTAGRGKKKVIDEDSEDDDDDIIMDDGGGNEGTPFNIANGHHVEDDDIEDDESSQAMFFTDTRSKSKPAATKTGTTAPKRGSRAGSTTSSMAQTGGRKTVPAATRKPSARAATAKAKQSTLNFSASQASVLGVTARSQSIEISDDDDGAFEPMSTARSRR